MAVYASTSNEEAGRPAWFGRRAADDPAALEAFAASFGRDGGAALLRRAARGEVGAPLGARSLLWKVALGVLPVGDPKAWPEAARRARGEYAALRESIHVDPTGGAAADDDGGTAWGRYHADAELASEIAKDVERLYPTGVDNFFEEPGLRAIMSAVLFTFAKTKRGLGYRQGMHELLAPLMYALECDKLRAPARPPPTGSDAALLALVCADSATALEADAFAMFASMMEPLLPLYTVTEAPPRLHGLAAEQARRATAPPTAAAAAAEALGAKHASPVLAVAARVLHKHVRAANASLHAHLVSLEIEPQLFCMRWCRLMFGREFHMNDVQTLWDGMLAASGLPATDGGCPLMDAIEFMAAAMVLYIRDKLSSDDYGTVLQPLMRYPAVGDVRDVFATAMALRAGKEAPLGHARPRPASPAPALLAATPSRLAASAPPGGGDLGGGGVSAAVAAVAAADAAQSERLHAFYLVHNPTKVGDVPKILAQYRGREAAMWAALEKKYGLAEGAAGGGGGGGAAPGGGADRSVSSMMSGAFDAVRTVASSIAALATTPLSAQLPPPPVAPAPPMQQQQPPRAAAAAAASSSLAAAAPPRAPGPIPRAHIGAPPAAGGSVARSHPDLAGRLDAAAVVLRAAVMAAGADGGESGEAVLAALSEVEAIARTLRVGV